MGKMYFSEDIQKAVKGKFYIDPLKPNIVYRVDSVLRINDVLCVRRTLYNLDGDVIGEDVPSATRTPRSLVDCMDDVLAEKFKPKEK